MKHTKKLLLSVVIGLALSACGGEKAQTNTPAKPASSVEAAAPAAPANQGNVLKVGAYTDYPPFEFRDEKGQVQGFEIELLTAIAKNAGLNVNVEGGLREHHADDVNKGKYDVWASAFYAENLDAEKVDFTKPYMNDVQLVVAINDNPEHQSIQTVADLKGKKIGVAKYYGQAGLELASKLAGSPDNVVQFDSFFLSARELYGNKVDAVLGANFVMAHFAAEASKAQQLNTRYITLPDTPKRSLVFVVKKGNTDLVNKLNQGIDKAKADGTIDQLRQKWLPVWKD